MKHLHMNLAKWEFRGCGDEEWLPATVPGTVHTDLLKNGKISDPFYGTNEHDLQWIDKKDWEYQTSLQLGEEWQELACTELVFEGLDTYADVYVNNVHVLAADNMFLAWKVDVKDQLKTGENNIRVKFRSVVKEDLPKLAKLGYALPASNDQSELGGLDEQRISIFARKAPYHYGWDWGPRFLTSGIWRAAALVGRDTVQITDLYIRQNVIAKEEARLTAIVEVDAPAAWRGMLRISADGLEWMQAVTLEEGMQQLEMNIVISEPQLWWCRGLGEPHLYTFQAELIQDAEVEVSKSVKTGLRSIELIRERDAKGASFSFALNGVSVFVKGANHIPNDSFTTEVTEERYRHEIATAVESNMNMLRVWGGGIYEEDIFYQLCDEYGLLVWQDFMFACSMYPGDEAFLENVKKEAEYNVKRLRNHPCIALWCGNNEIDSAWSQFEENMGWGWKEKLGAEQRTTMWADYIKIFHRILPEAVAAFHPGVDYWPSSPLRELTGDINQHATRIVGEGDVHYWGVWHGIEPFENYNTKVGRFMSEYGFQSFPELKTVMSYAEEQDLELTSEVMLAHQKNGRGNLLIKEYMDMYLPQPKDFKAFLYMSQILQAEAIRIAIESHRRNKPYCMGTLYWQMNDCWPVASWAGMDYNGRWKALQYTVRSSFQDVLLSIDGTDREKVDVHVVSDLRTAVSAELVLTLYQFNGSVLREWAHPVELGADSAAIVFSSPVAELLEGQGVGDVLLGIGLQADGQVIDHKLHYFTPEKEIPLQRSVITVLETPESSGLSFTVTSDVLARGVYLTSEEEGIFSDNYFDLLPGQTKTIEFSQRGNDGRDWIPAAPKGLKVQSMVDFVSEDLL
ncbi:glycoside hydrolase family 2 protein [Paenibacillus sp. FSL R7-0048]|uniref:beta-mannosidase n=1 Tax=Paenibacillus TaxID=44249 RepID=UPI0009701F3A|nr:glycoside hydrolase family 2 protein [Paenibacillus odorifer]OMD65683.1 beta-galactosidase [Paenibacillus odorifer]OMD77376.1 beta-galactosidase [Paenibacillus odorifer]OMD99212.1 beta-galactosidase [Paenibacillus odorifer]